MITTLVSQILMGGKIDTNSFHLPNEDPFVVFILPKDPSSETVYAEIPAGECRTAHNSELRGPLPLVVGEWNPILFTDIAVNSALNDYYVYWGSTRPSLQ